MNRSTPKKRNIGQKVRYYRVQSGLSQKDLAARLQTIGCDMTSEMIWKAENGRRNLSIFEIDKLAEVLNVDYNALFAQDGEIK
nr:helix-turn-helix transcriptional regulator [uncultured Oscillibacter sp.]